MESVIRKENTVDKDIRRECLAVAVAMEVLGMELDSRMRGTSTVVIVQPGELRMALEGRLMRLMGPEFRKEWEAGSYGAEKTRDGG